MAKLKQHHHDYQKQEPILCPKCNRKWDENEIALGQCSNESCNYPFIENDEFSFSELGGSGDE